LSDERVAELEKAISGSRPLTNTPDNQKESVKEEPALSHAPTNSVFVGKKGNSTNTVEETVSGHLEGDAPVRVSKEEGKAPLLPAGESGPIVSTTPKVNPTNETTSEGLPSEVEARAKAIGQSAGKLSAGAAEEVETPDKPVGQGRKGTRGTEEPEAESKAEPKAPANVRPRRVNRGDSPPPTRNQ
jgi:hypothetical protein